MADVEEQADAARRDTITFRSSVEDLRGSSDYGEGTELDANLRFHRDEICSVPHGDKAPQFVHLKSRSNSILTIFSTDFRHSPALAW